MIPKKILNFKIKVAGVRNIWYSKYLLLNYLILTLAILFLLLFVYRSNLDSAKETFNERSEALSNYLFLDEISTVEDILKKCEKINNLKTGASLKRCFFRFRGAFLVAIIMP